MVEAKVHRQINYLGTIRCYVCFDFACLTILGCYYFYNYATKQANLIHIFYEKWRVEMKPNLGHGHIFLAVHASSSQVIACFFPPTCSVYRC